MRLHRGPPFHFSCKASSSSNNAGICSIHHRVKLNQPCSVQHLPSEDEPCVIVGLERTRLSHFSQISNQQVNQVVFQSNHFHPFASHAVHLDHTITILHRVGRSYSIPRHSHNIITAHSPRQPKHGAKCLFQNTIT